MTTANGNIRTGHLVGGGAAVNVSLGWVPNRVDVFNLTDGTKFVVGFPGAMVAFTSGGTATPVAGQRITGITSGAYAKIKDIVLASGTWAGGDAAGYFICDADEVVGTFQSENVTFSGQPAAEDDATVAAQVEHSIYTATTAGPVSGSAATTGIASYVGDSTHAKGFTIGSTVAASGKLLRWEAFRN